MIFATLSLSGNIPVDNDWLIIRLRTELISNDIDLSKMVDMLSWPELDLGFSLLMIFNTRSDETVLNSKEKVILSVRKFVYALLGGVGISLARFGPMFVKKLLKQLAISLSPVIIVSLEKKCVGISLFLSFLVIS